MRARADINFKKLGLKGVGPPSSSPYLRGDPREPVTDLSKRTLERPRPRPKSYGSKYHKFTKYNKYQESILYIERALYIKRNICLMIEAIINIINKKTYWQKYNKNY